MDRECPVCGASFTVSGLSHARVYCSPRCSNRAKYERNVASGYEAVKTARAKARYNTDPEYRARKLGRILAWNQAHRTVREPLPAVECGFCGSPFQPLQRTHRYCSRRCRDDACRGRSPDEMWRPVRVQLAALVGQTDVPEWPNRVVTVNADVLPTGGLWVYCPFCGQMVGGTMWTRVCLVDVVVVRLNPEEGSWVIFEQRSTCVSSRPA